MKPLSKRRSSNVALTAVPVEGPICTEVACVVKVCELLEAKGAPKAASPVAE